MARQGYRVEAIEFSDDGRGFDYRKLELDLSDKPGDEEWKASEVRKSRGQHGEGLKLAAASAILEGMGVEIYSKNWKAVPVKERLTVDGMVAHRLSFEVSLRQDGGVRRGSRTVFHNPTPAVLEELARVEKSVLPFRPGYRPLYEDGKGNAVVGGEGHIFVKGMIVTREYADKLMFSYDLNTDDVPRDRDYVKQNVIGNPIGAFIAESEDKELIKAILSRALRRDGEQTDRSRDFMELQYVPPTGHTGWHGQIHFHPEVWQVAFREIYGAQAVLHTSDDAKKLAQLAGYAVITCSAYTFNDFLKRMGIPTDSSVGESNNAFLLEDIDDASSAELRTLETSYTLSHRAKKWGLRRMLLDAIANHTPADSGGTSIRIEFKMPRERWVDAYDWMAWQPGKNYDRAVETRITDDGQGYHFTNLMYASSDKPQAEIAMGQFGEGLKLLSAAALRTDDIRIKFRSQNWVASPFASVPKQVGRKDEKVLCMQVLEGVQPIDGSVTTIRGMNAELGLLLQHLDNYVLTLREDLTYLHSVDGTHMFRESRRRIMPNGAVFNKDVHITDSFASQLLFSYNLQTDDISPDRDNVNREVLRGSVVRLVRTTTNRQVIEGIIKAAAGRSGVEYMEFIDAELAEDVARAWVDSFRGMFGRDAVLFSSEDRAMVARHMGFRVIKLNERVARTLHAAGIEYDREVADEGLVPTEVSFDDLTPEERQVLARFREVEETLGLPPHRDVRIFSKVQSRTGRDLSDRLAGYWDANSGAMYMARHQLSHWPSAKRTYIHERGHKETAASDPTDPFRHFFEYYVSAFVGKELARKHGDPSYQVGVEAFTRWDVERLEWLRMENADLAGRIARLQEERDELRTEVDRLRTQKPKADTKLEEEQSAAPVEERHNAPGSGLVKGLAVEFSFRGKRYAVQPIPRYHNSTNPIELVAWVLTHKRTFMERMMGLFGKPTLYEKRVEVFRIERSGERLLGQREAMKVLRRVARESEPGRSTYTGAIDAIDSAKHRLGIGPRRRRRR